MVFSISLPFRAVGALLLAAIVLMTGLPVAPAESAQESAADDLSPESAIVVLEPGTDPLAAAADLGVVPTEVYRDVFTGFAAKLPPAAATAARRSPLVRKIAPDGLVRAESQQTPTGVARVGTPLDGNRAERKLNVDVAVIDSGVAKLPDLRVAGGVACNGQDPYVDNYNHGTPVAGVIGAINNNREVVGVAPGARIWSVKVLDASGVGKWSEVLCGLDWVYRNRQTIDVVNMSLSGNGKDGRCSSMPVHAAICRIVAARIPVVVAAGNQAKKADQRIPAAWDQVLTVSAFADVNGEPRPPSDNRTCDNNRDDAWWYASNYGPNVDIAAPGSCILSLNACGSTSRDSGTSFAAPHVAGAVARYKAERPNASDRKVRSWLLSEASRPQDSDVGFTGDPDNYREPVLWLGG